ncbi:hypothetical protein SAMN05660909_04131 [Chitinophaga terrae (ex Kim and Jung 2007)]|uniref:Uncharacterized protein n=1 Tax=Chitinophaga terrae (ex Kim and Jung 2007) TaxID=408074 RepID=A0A1H4F3E7_9BACT|nr:hypothetical protein SAMN05660909_04131 [Chitinophaga terrae (ex Kim and Jung 2007)]
MSTAPHNLPCMSVPKLQLILKSRGFTLMQLKTQGVGCFQSNVLLFSRNSDPGKIK